MTTKPRYIYVKNWDEHQAERTPHWIRIWAKKLLHDDAWLSLTLPQRGLLLGIWMLVSQSGNGRVSGDLVQLNQQLGGTSAQETSLQALNQAGFITFRSHKARSRVRAKASLEKKRVDIPPTPLRQGVGEAQNGQQPDPESDPLAAPDQAARAAALKADLAKAIAARSEPLTDA